MGEAREISVCVRVFASAPAAAAHVLLGKALVLLVASGGCQPSATPPARTAVELPIGKIGEGGKLVTLSAAADEDATCTLRLIAGAITKSSPTCYLDEHITEKPGLLRYACRGGGNAEAVFGEHGEQTYRGTVSRQGEIHITASGELDWEDGCRWGTEAIISGWVPLPNVDNITRTVDERDGKLEWTYSDRVLSGNACSGVCYANTQLHAEWVTKPKGITGAPSVPDDWHGGGGDEDF